MTDNESEDNLEKIQDSNDEVSDDVCSNISSEIFFEAIKFEYEHSIHRPERLDNKLYISLAVYAFLAVILSDSIVVSFKDNILSGIYCAILAIVIVLFLCTLGFLLYLLKSEEIHHYNCKEIVKDDIMQIKSTKEICSAYIEHICHNNHLLNKKNKYFNVCMLATGIVLIGVMILKFLSKLVVNM